MLFARNQRAGLLRLKTDGQLEELKINKKLGDIMIRESCKFARATTDRMSLFLLHKTQSCLLERP